MPHAIFLCLVLCVVLGTELHDTPEDGSFCALLLLIVSNPDKVARRSEGCPRDVEPAIAGQQLVGIGAGAEKVHQALELLRVFGADVGSLTQQVLGVLDTTNQGIDARVAEARVDDDGTDLAACRFQQILAAVFQVEHDLRRWQVVGVLTKVAEFCQREMITELDVFH